MFQFHFCSGGRRGVSGALQFAMLSFCLEVGMESCAIPQKAAGRVVPQAIIQ